MSDNDSVKDVDAAIQAIDQSASVKEIQQVLAEARKYLKAMPDDSNPIDRARGLLDVAEPLLGLGLGDEAWQYAREEYRLRSWALAATPACSEKPATLPTVSPN